MRLRLFWQDLGWAAFILVIAAAMGLLYHWPLVKVGLRGEMAAHLEKQRTRQWEMRFQGVKTVSLDQAYAMYREGKALFIDARVPKEYVELHVPGALNLPPDQLKDRAAQALAGVPKDRQLVVYCGVASCDAALKVAEKLQALGFTQVAAFLGGFRVWDEAGYPADTGK